MQQKFWRRPQPLDTARVCHAMTILAIMTAPALYAQEDFGELSLDDLLNIEVVTVSKQAEPVGEAPAPIHVVTGEAILRSGARNIAEALRLVPGVHVARSNAQSYSVSIRGFASTSSDKLEVLIDGRSVYTPLFSGVFWDSFDTLLADIERIEVVRGPGATLWGANAVNGVINIVTKSARDTTGTLVLAGGGTELRGHAALRSGHAFENGALRVYAKSYDLDASEQADGSDAIDGQRFAQAGFRADWSLSSRDEVMLTGDVFNQSGETSGALGGSVVEAQADGANINALWTRSVNDKTTLSAGGYLEQSRRRTQELFSEERDTADMSVQLSTRLAKRHNIVAGIGYRRSSDDTGAPPDLVIFEPQSRTVETINVFVQDRISLGQRTTLDVGSKFEHNDFTGSEIQPAIRLGYKASDQRYFWGSVSRAVRTPNRLDQDLAIFCPEPDGIPGVCGPGRFRIGNPDFASEAVIAYEFGARQQFSDRVSLDLALFYNDYSDLRSTETGGGPFGSFQNRHEGTGTGGELTATTQLSERWILQAWYSYLDLDVDPEPGSTDTTTEATVEGSSPEHQAGLIARFSSGAAWNSDIVLRHVSKLEAGDVPAYTEADLTVGYTLNSHATLRAIGRNLLDSSHREFGAPTPAAGTFLERSLVLQAELTW